MAGQLNVSTINAPGFLGLNSQESEVTLESGFATQAFNCVIDRSGRLASRRGYVNVTTNRGTLGAAETIKSLFEFKDVAGSTTVLSAGGGKLFTGLSTLTEKKLRNSANTADIPLVSTANNWQWASLQNGTGATATAEAFAAQSGNPMIMYRNPGGGYIFQRVGDIGAVPAGYTVDSFDPNCVLSAFGRIWAGATSVEKLAVYYSTLVGGATFSGVGSGRLDISSVVGNNDEITAITAHNGFLIIFTKNNIVVYNNADNPSSITLADVVRGVGCLARDTVQNTGTDVAFLSRSGVRSLARTIEENTMPMREVSLNVRDDLVADLGNETLANIKSAYFERDAFYLLSLPATQRIYCFDTRNLLDNGASRTTIWVKLPYTAFLQTESRQLYFGIAGGIAEYRGYQDNGQQYRMIYFTSNTDFGSPSQLKMLKKVNLVVISNQTQDFVIKYGFDYKTIFTPRISFSNESQVPSEYKIAEYGIGEYTGGLLINTLQVNLGGSGRVVKFGVETEVNGSPVAIQKADLFLKTGKIL